MANGIRRDVSLAPGDADVLEQIVMGSSWAPFQVQRARLVLGMAAGRRVVDVAAEAGCDTSTVWRICRRYERGGLARLLYHPPRIAGLAHGLRRLRRAEILRLARVRASSGASEGAGERPPESGSGRWGGRRRAAIADRPAIAE